VKVSRAAIDMIKHHEGVRTKPYRCPALLWTVGVGHVIDPTHAAVKYEERKNLPIPAGWDRVLTMDEVDGILSLLLLAIKESSILSSVLPSTWVLAISNVLPFG
jgi:hypothetical protein